MRTKSTTLTLYISQQLSWHKQAYANTKAFTMSASRFNFLAKVILFVHLCWHYVSAQFNINTYCIYVAKHMIQDFNFHIYYFQ